MIASGTLARKHKYTKSKSNYRTGGRDGCKCRLFVLALLLDKIAQNSKRNHN